MISLLVLACISHARGFLVMICHWNGGFPGLTMIFPGLSISSNSHGVVGFFLFFFFLWLILIFLKVVG